MPIVLDGSNGINTPSLSIGGVPSAVVLTASVEGSGGVSDWTQATAADPYIATKTVTGILATDSPIVDINLSSVAFADVEAVQGDFALVYRVEASADNEIKFYALDEPVEDFTIQIQVVR